MWNTFWNFSNVQVIRLIIGGMICVFPLISTWKMPLKNEGNEEPANPAQERFFFKYTSPWWGLPKFDISKEAKKSWKVEDGYFGRPTWGPHKFPGVYSVTVINPQFIPTSTAVPPTSTTTVTPPKTTAETVTVIVKYKRLPSGTSKPSDEEDECSYDHKDDHDSGYETKKRKPKGRSQKRRRRRRRKQNTPRSLGYPVVPYFIPAFYF